MAWRVRLQRDQRRRRPPLAFERLDKNNGQLNIFRALSHSPEALLRFMRFGSYLLTEGKLDPATRELAILRSGYLCHSPYEFSQHIAFARRAKLTDAQIRGIANPTTQLFDPKQMAVIAYAGEMTSHARVPTRRSTLSSHFNNEEIVELTLVTGFYNLVSRTLNALGRVDPPAQATSMLGVHTARPSRSRRCPQPPSAASVVRSDSWHSRPGWSPCRCRGSRCQALLRGTAPAESLSLGRSRGAGTPARQSAKAGPARPDLRLTPARLRNPSITLTKRVCNTSALSSS
jgi:alkylhydroperoxidase family enzyme